MSALTGLLSGFPVKPVEVFEQGNQVTVWAKSSALFKDEVKDTEMEWKFEGDYTVLFFLNEKGQKIERIVEFVDSAKSMENRKLFRRARENLAKSVIDVKPGVHHRQ